MNIAKHLFVVFFIVSTLGCKTKSPSTYQYKNSSDIYTNNGNFDYSWNDTLGIYKDEMKKEWLNRTSPKIDFYDLYNANTIYNLPSSNINSSTLQLLPISVYVINQTDFRDWEKDKPILDLLNLSKTTSKGFLTRAR
jgi:hypothetical protein